MTAQDVWWFLVCLAVVGACSHRTPHLRLALVIVAGAVFLASIVAGVPA